REGEQKVLPSTDSEYFIENKKFTLETYDAEDEENEKFKDAIEQQGMIEKNYQTDEVIYKAKNKEIAGEEEELEKVKEGSLQMNKPMKFDGYTLYQSGYQENEFSDMTFGIYETDEEDGDSLGEVTIDTLKPDQEYE